MGLARGILIYCGIPYYLFMDGYFKDKLYTKAVGKLSYFHKKHFFYKKWIYFHEYSDNILKRKYS